MGTYLFFQIFLSPPFILFLFKELEKNHVFEKNFFTRKALLTEMKSRPREHAHEEGFKSISSDALSICHKTSSKLFLVIDILHLVHCFKISFCYMCFLFLRKVALTDQINVFVRRNCKELWGNLKQWYLVNGHGNLFFLFYISKHCMIDNNNL